MKSATKKTAPRRAASRTRTVPFAVPAPIESALKTAAERVETVKDQTRDVAAKVEERVRTAAESVKKTGQAIRKDPKKFVDNVVKDGKTFGQKIGKRAEKVTTDAAKESKRLAEMVSRRAADAVEGVIEKALHRFNVPTRQELRSLTAKVEALNKKIDSLGKTRTRASR